MTVTAIRQILTALVNQRRKVFAMKKYVVAYNAANQRSLMILSNNVGYLSQCERLDSWARMVVRMENDILNLLPGKKFRKQREQISQLITDCKQTLEQWPTQK